MPLSDVIRFEFALETETYDYRTPMKFGGRVVKDVTVLTARCDVELRSGLRTFRREGVVEQLDSVHRKSEKGGMGSMTMGVAWAWPHTTLTDDVKLNVLLTLAGRLADELNECHDTGHPLEICEAIVERRDRLAAEVATGFGLVEPIPALAVLLAASPIEAALFDAQGKAMGVSSFQLLGKDCVSSDLSRYLGPEYSGRYLNQYISATPADSMPLYHLVGALDPLDQQDVKNPVADGLPETLGEWIRRDGLSHLKIKLAGDSLSWDVNRVLGVQRVAQTYGKAGQTWAYSLDFNERCESADYVIEMLDEIAQRCPEAYRSIQYIEQPTHRELFKNPQNLMHRVAERLPVVIDESLVDLASLRLAIEQGYSGVALKACKGHSEALLMAAVAKQDNLYLCVQDLTCVGISLLHSASLAAHIPGVAAIESNGRQYCPAANASWTDAFPGMFDVHDGRLPTSCLAGPGLGY
jgi:L-alanine-DL-glutamate epimerase-like enolase superfamily enzyme